MKTRGKLVKIYKAPTTRKCPNCHQEYIITQILDEVSKVSKEQYA